MRLQLFDVDQEDLQPFFEERSRYQGKDDAHCYVFHFKNLDTKLIGIIPPQNGLLFNLTRPANVSKKILDWDDMINSEKRKLERIFRCSKFKKSEIPFRLSSGNFHDYIFLPSRLVDKVVYIYQHIINDDPRLSIIFDQVIDRETAYPEQVREFKSRLQKKTSLDQIMVDVDSDLEGITREKLFKNNPFLLYYCVAIMPNLSADFSPTTMKNVLSVRLSRSLKWRHLYNMAKIHLDHNFGALLRPGPLTDIDKLYQGEIISFCEETEAECPYLRDDFLN